jgi:hypothetical protein
MIDPALTLLARGSLTLLFLAAAIHKLRHSQEFVGVVAAYQLTGERSSAAIARLLPALELAVAAGLWITPTREAAAVLGGALLAIYAAAIAINLRRGRRDIDCGCAFSGRGRSPIGAWMLVRNAVLIGVVLLASAPIASRALTPVDALTVIGGLCVLTLLYMAADGLHSLELQS